MFVEWDNDRILLLKTKELVITEELYDLSVKLEFTGICSKEEKKYINEWYNNISKKSLILTWEIKNKRMFYLFNNGFLKSVYFDNQGNLISFKFKFEKYKNITRKYKIQLVLNTENIII